MVEYPKWLRIGIYTSAIVHDIAIICAGWFSFQEAPRTILNALPEGPRLVWSTMFIIGGLMALIGIGLRNVRFETTGCVLTACAKLVWVVAALTPILDVLGTDTLACILIAGAAGTMWRFCGIWVGQYLRVRE